MQAWQKNYHKLYLELKNEYDPHVIQWISGKEDVISSAPFAHGILGHQLSGIRRYKGGKLRILYVLSTEKPSLWDSSPPEQELLFLYVDLRCDDTYKEALSLLRKHQII